MRRCYAGENLIALGASLLARALENPRDAHAYLDFSTVLQLTGNRAHGLAVQSEAIKIQWLYDLPGSTSETSMRLLVMMRPGDFMANTPVELLLEHSAVSLQLLYLPPDEDWPEVVPDHDVMMVAVGESDDSQLLLERLTHYVADWPRPIINRPENIAKLSRDTAYSILQDIPGIEMPMSVRIGRMDLQAIAQGDRKIFSFLDDGGFPLIIRPMDSHAGKNLEKITTAAEITSYLARVPDQVFYIARYVDYKSSDQLFRKYRIVLIEGKPFICHLAVSEHWAVHYTYAGMEDDARKREEEMHCMEHFDTDFVVRHGAALQALADRIGLPYFGVDCAENQQGALLLFEVDHAMVVHSLDSEVLFPYKKPIIEKIFYAFQEMLKNATLR